MSEETAASVGAVENAETQQQITEEFAREQIEKADPETPAQTAAEPKAEEEISYHAVEKEGKVTAIWEMQGRKHLRTIAPRSSEGKHILSLFTSEHHEEAA
ncbi:MAG: hypothetical protein ACR2N3_05435 [Pyrinomonadaceae bacterium]